MKRNSGTGTAQVLILLTFLFYFAILLFGIKDPMVLFNDSGFNYFQLIQFVDSGFSDFRFHYLAKEFDPTGVLLPYTLPWVSMARGETFMQYPPWFFLTELPFYLLLQERGFFLFNFIWLSGIFILFYKLTRKDSHPVGMLFWSLAFYVFGTTLTFYSLHFHEYILTWFLSGMAYFFALRAVTREFNKINVFLYGLFSGLATAYRLEIMIALFPIGVHLVFYNKRINWKEAFVALLGFALPLSVIFTGNQILHGHPLSLRYVVNVTQDGAKTIADRITVIREILFDKDMGLLVQSPWVLLVPVIGYLYRKEKMIRISAIWFSVSTLLVLLSLPNSGSHFAPRYLYGTMMAAALVIARPLSGIGFSLSAWKESWSSRKSGVLLASVLLILFVYSTGRYKKEMKSHLSFETTIRNINAGIHSIPPSDLIVFREFASAKNAQVSIVRRPMVVVEDESEAEVFGNAWKNRKGGPGHFTIAFPIFEPAEKVEPILQSDKREGWLAKIPVLNLEDFPGSPVEIRYREPFLLIRY